MSTRNHSSARWSPALRAGIVRRLTAVVGFLIFNAALLFLAAGRPDWLWAWVFLGICLLSLSVNCVVLLRAHPETVAERGQPGATPGWDKVVAGLWALSLFLVVPVVAGLDERFAWTRALPTGWHLAGLLLLVAGLALAGWAMLANAFFSTAVRIQAERGHAVCRDGPYRFVRHPGYLGFILQSLGTPILLGSAYALIAGVLAAGLMAIRTALEDRLLSRELPGYHEFARDVRYRLLPGLW